MLMCATGNCGCGCEQIVTNLIEGPQGPQGVPGIDGTDGINGTNGINGAAIIQMMGPQTSLIYSIDEDKTLNFLSIPANILTVGNKLEVIFLLKVDSITTSELYPKISVSSSISNTLPTIGGAIQSPFSFIGPIDSPKENDIYIIRYQISRLATNVISIEGDYRMSPAPSSGISGISASSTTRTLYNYNAAFAPNLSNAFYISVGIGQDMTACTATLLYASAELKSEI